MKQLQIFDLNALIGSTKHLSIPARDPSLCRVEAQVLNLALSLTVNSASSLVASLTDGLKAFVGFHMDMSPGCIGGNCLIDNFDSTKGEIGCYSRYGHRRPPLVIVLFRS